MSVIGPILGPLLRKELRQSRRSRGALTSTVALSAILMLVVPLGQLAALQATSDTAAMPLGRGLPPGLAGLDTPTDLFARAIFPMLTTICGLIVPSIAAIHTVVVERERRTIELLAALPVRVSDILIAKLAANLILAVAIMGPLFAIDAAVLLAIGAAGPWIVAQTALVLVAALACSTGSSLLVALLARDFRSANNVNGLFAGPLILLVTAIVFGLPGAARLLVLAAVLLVVGGAATLVAVRWLTFERYLA